MTPNMKELLIEEASKSNCRRRKYACAFVLNDTIIAIGHNYVDFENNKDRHDDCLTGCNRLKCKHGVDNYEESGCYAIHAEEDCYDAYLKLVPNEDSRRRYRPTYILFGFDNEGCIITHPTPCYRCQELLDKEGIYPYGFEQRIKSYIPGTSGLQAYNEMLYNVVKEIRQKQIAGASKEELEKPAYKALDILDNDIPKFHQHIKDAITTLLAPENEILF